MPLLGGIRPPVAALLVLLLAVAAATALVLGRDDDPSLPRAVRDSQQHTAEDGAVALRAALDESTSDLQRSAAMFNAAKPVSPDAELRTLGSVYQKWRGTAIVGLDNGNLLAARGETVPLSGVDTRNLPAGLPPRLVTTASGATRLLVFAELDGTQGPELLIASDSLQVPSIATGGGRTLQVIGPDGGILAANGPIPQGKAAKTLAARAARSVIGRRPSETAASGGFDGPSGSLLGGMRNGDRTVAGYAGVTAGVAADGAAGHRSAALGLTVLTTVQVTLDTTYTGHRLFALGAAGVLLAFAAAVTWVLHRVLQRPLLTLHIEARRLARGDCARPVDPPRFGEPALIGNALENLRKQLLGARLQSGRAVSRRSQDRTGTRTVLVVCAVLLLSWGAPLLLLFNRADHVAVVPQQLVEDQRRRTETAADRVRQGLNEGYVDVASVATAVGAGSSDRTVRQVLDTTVEQHGRYRSLYLVDRHGTVLARAGESPRTPVAARRREGVGLVDDHGTEPVIAARAPVPDSSGRIVVGEYDITYLDGIITRPGLGRTWLVDHRDRVVASSEGFRAFEPLPDHRTHDLADSAGQDSIGALLRDGDTTLAAAAPLVGSGAASTFHTWHVVSEQPASWLRLPEYDLQRRTMLAGLLGLAAAATCLGWLHIVVVRPLRALADAAEALAGGDRRTVLFPVHHDEVGSVVRSLELIRQRLVRERRAIGVPGAPPGPAAAPPGRTAPPTGRRD
jgi:HAMP domain-containing protein